MFESPLTNGPHQDLASTSAGTHLEALSTKNNTNNEVYVPIHIFDSSHN